jgi:hypothetical protein
MGLCNPPHDASVNRIGALTCTTSESRATCMHSANGARIADERIQPELLIRPERQHGDDGYFMAAPGQKSARTAMNRPTPPTSGRKKWENSATLMAHANSPAGLGWVT